jgi:hypothetical protein
MSTIMSINCNNIIIIWIHFEYIFNLSGKYTKIFSIEAYVLS